MGLPGTLYGAACRCRCIPLLSSSASGSSDCPLSAGGKAAQLVALQASGSLQHALTPMLSLQDWAYVVGKCFELTLEVNDAKHPPAQQLPELFADNLPALLRFAITAAFGGLR